MAKRLYTEKDRRLRHKLVEAREQAGLRQMDVSKTGIISQSELSKIENGQRRVEFLLVVELAKLYGKDLSFFLPEE